MAEITVHQRVTELFSPLRCSVRQATGICRLQPPEISRSPPGPLQRQLGHKQCQQTAVELESIWRQLGVKQFQQTPVELVPIRRQLGVKQFQQTAVKLDPIRRQLGVKQFQQTAVELEPMGWFQRGY